MLQVKNLNITHIKDFRTIVSELSFVLNKGDKIAVIGEEGNGKSTLLKWIYNPKLITSYTESDGEMICNGLIGYLGQEISSDDNEKTIYDFFNNDEPFFGETINELSQIAKQLDLSLEFFYSNQLINTLSGGEKIKLQMAKLLAKNPDILLLDEPSNDIDIETLEWLECFINNLDSSVIYISHDEHLIEKTANRIIHIERIRRKTVPRITIANCNYREYVTKRQNRIRKQEQLAKKEMAQYNVQQEKWWQIYQRVDYEQRLASKNPASGRLLKKKMHAVKAMHRRFEKQKNNMTQRPDVEEQIFLSLNSETIPKGKRVLNLQHERLMVGNRLLSAKVDLSINGAQHICIVGRNGSGKTTLLKLIMQKLSQRNDISVFYMPQDYKTEFEFYNTPMDYLSKTGSKQEKDKIMSYLGSLNFTSDEMHHPISELSSGQKAKLFFVKISLGDYNVLILDEPTRNISVLSNHAIRNFLKSFNGVIISVSHDRKYIDEVCETLYKLTDSRLVRLEKSSYLISN